MNENYFLVLFQIPFLIGIGLIVFYFLKTEKLLKIEEGKKSLYRGRCGGTINFVNMSFPFLRFAIYDNFLVIRYFTKDIVLNYVEITDVFIKRYVFNKGIFIKHKKKNVPDIIILYFFDNEKIFEILKSKIKNVEVID